MGDGDAGSTVEWQTPNDLFDAYDAEFGPFTLDPASALGFHTSDVILARPGGGVCTLDGFYATDPETGELDKLGDYSGLDIVWRDRVWLNHPYGREDWRWMKKAHDSVRFGSADIVVALVPVKTQMKWWRKYVGATELTRVPDLDTVILDGYYGTKSSGADVIRFMPKRLVFGGAPSSAPFNSAVIVWRK